MPFMGLIHKTIKIWRHCKIDKQYSYLPSSIEIWDYSSLKDWLTFYSTDEYIIKIWKFCTISKWATFIAASSHDYNCLTTYSRLIKPKEFKDVWANIEIGNDVRIGTNAIIMKWVTIWTWAVIWAWAVVTKDVPPYAIVGWNPAKIIKYRFDWKTISKLLESERWNRDIEKIIKNYYLEFINK